MGVLANGEDRRGDELELNELELDAAVRQLTLIEERVDLLGIGYTIFSSYEVTVIAKSTCECET